jgi:hypothetical protein
MHIQWFEDKINFSIPPTQDNLDRFTQYANTYAEYDMPAASLACVLCTLVVECKTRGSSVYGALQAYTGVVTEIYYLPDLPLTARDYTHIQDVLDRTMTPYDSRSLKGLGHDLCAIFPLVKRLSINPDHLLFVAIVAAELLMSSSQADMIVPLQLDVEQIEARFGL